MAKSSGTGERSEKKRAVRRSIVNAALQLCKTKGYSGISLREITREAGIAAPSFYNHFSDLEDLGLAIIDEAGVTLRQLMRRARKNTDVDEGVIRRSVGTFNHFLQENGDIFHFIVAERVGGTKAFRTAIEREVSHMIEDLADSLEEEGQRKLRPIAYPLYIADLIVNCVFSAGAESLNQTTQKKRELVDKSVIQVRAIMYGAESLAQKAARPTGQVQDDKDTKNNGE